MGLTQLIGLSVAADSRRNHFVTFELKCKIL